MDLDGAVWCRVLLSGVLGLGSFPRMGSEICRGEGCGERVRRDLGVGGPGVCCKQAVVGQGRAGQGRLPRASSVDGSLVLAVLFLVGSRQNPFSWRLLRRTNRRLDYLQPGRWMSVCCRCC